MVQYARRLGDASEHLAKLEFQLFLHKCYSYAELVAGIEPMILQYQLARALLTELYTDIKKGLLTSYEHLQPCKWVQKSERSLVDQLV